MTLQNLQNLQKKKHQKMFIKIKILTKLKTKLYY